MRRLASVLRWLIILTVGPAVAWMQGAQVPPEARDIRDEYLHRSWTREHGLPDNRVYAITQTQDGYLWVGTSAGLARFDGAQFVVFNRANTPDMGNEACLKIMQDGTGALWVGTEGGVLLQRRATGAFRLYQTEKGPDSRQLRLLTAGREGVWAQSVDGVLLYHLASDRVLGAYVVDAGRSPGITDAHETARGRLWIGRSDGAGWLDPVSGNWRPGTPPVPGTPPLAHAAVLQAGDYVDLAGSWPLGPGQLYRFANGAWTLCATNLIHNESRPLFLTQDREGNLWMPQAGVGLARFSSSGVALLRVPFEEAEYVLCLQQDRDGALWFGTENAGLHRLQPRRIQTLTTADGLAGDNPECALEAKDGTFWIGTDKGLSHFTGDACTNFREHDGLARPIVRALAQDRNGIIWIGTLGGLNFLEGGRLKEFHIPGDWVEGKIRALLVGRDGALWVGTVRGLHRVQGEQRWKGTTAEGLGANEVLALLEDRDGSIWVGTAGGGVNRLNWFPPRHVPGETPDPRVAILSLNTANGLSSNFVRCLLQDNDGVLWIGTDRGLNRYSPNGRFAVLDTRHGLPDNQVTELVEDGAGSLWVGFDRGVYRASLRALNEAAAGRLSKVPVVPYDTADGLPSPEVSGKLSQPAAGRTRDGRIWFATARGMAFFDPKSLPDGTNPPAVIIEQVRANGNVVLDNGPQAVAPALHLPPGGARILEVDFTAATFTEPELTHFKYRLDGLDTDWIDAGHGRKAYYANLHPGAYRFRVIAANKHQVWNQAGASFAFDLAPFFYQRRWFPWVCGVLAAAGGYAAVLWRLWEVRKVHRLEQQIALDQQRSRIARDIHDELGATLTRIAQLSEDTNAALPTAAAAHAPTRRIALLAEEAIGSIGEIVWANNPRYDSLQDLVAFLREYAAEYLGSAAVAPELEFPDEVPVRSVPGPFRRHVLAVVKEALHNVVKHSGATQVAFALAVRDSRLRLTMQDNGCGLQEQQLRRFGNGLSNIRERIHELGGTFTIESKPGQGARLLMDIPLPTP
jgi:ligand-binding sensor domain-containing protein/signal transduction histidine kinase